MDFSNTEISYKHLTNKDLKRASFIFSVITKPFLVKTGKIFIRLAKFTRIPYGWAVRGNIFRHFCGGETIKQCLPVIQKLATGKCSSILDYSAEGLSGEKSFEKVKTEILSTLEIASTNTNISFGVFKMTGIADFSLLERISAQGRVLEEDRQLWQVVTSRVHEIFSSAKQKDIPVFVDAEETWIQPAIDMLIEEMMIQFNQEKPIVYTTIQMYTTIGFEKIRQLISFAEKNNIIAGVKLVRGAYMEKERDRAKEKGQASPVFDTKAHTDKSFNDAITYCFEKINAIHFCIASHNEQSNSLAHTIFETNNIELNDPRISFAQLYGMSDHITFNLAQSGFNVSKYLPYGPVQKVMPYLIRRAEENSSVAIQSNRELQNIRRERQRRKLLTRSVG